jgi:signal recognition particle subunit SRP54
MEERVKNATFTFDDLLNQMKMMKRMGSLKGIFGLMPGMGKLKDYDFSDSEVQMKIFEAIIFSMTKKERLGIDEITMGRKKRVANGAGVSLGDVNKLVKQFKQMKLLAKEMPKFQKNFSEGNGKKIDLLKKNPDFNRFFS